MRAALPRRGGPLLAAALLLLLPSVAAAEEPDSGWVEGVVLRYGTGEPVVGATVAVGAASTVTDDYGYAQLEVPPGVHAITVDGHAIEEVPTVPVRAGSVTEIILALDPEGLPAGGEVYAPPLPEEDLLQDGAPPETGLGPPGSIRGVIVTEDGGQPVPGARVFVRGLTEELTTDVEGVFEVELPSGVYDISVLAEGFSIETRKEITVPAGRATALELQLVPSSVALETFQVRAPRLVGGTADLLAEQKDAGAVASIIGAEQFARTADSSAADALKRVTGLSVVEDRFVYIRGMGERYSATELNGSSLPSPEPERRVVPLDLIPASLLDSVLIQKAYSPDKPGEFGGGVVVLRTRNYPETPLLAIKMKGAARVGTTGATGIGYQGGEWDWLGFDDGTRALPDEVAAASDDQPLLERDMFSELGYTAEELEAFGEALPNIWNVHERTIPPDTGLGISAGNKFDIAGRPLGVLIAASWSRDYKWREPHITIYNLGGGGELEEFHSYDFQTMNERVKGALLGNLYFSMVDDNWVADRFVLNRISDDMTRTYSGLNRDVGAPIRVTRLQWVERQLLSNQVSGSHRIHPLADFTFEYRFQYARATRAEPDRREYRYDREEQDEDVWIISDRPEGNYRLYSDLVDNHYDLQMDFKMPIPFAEDREGWAGGGFQVLRRDREVDTRRFKFKHKGGAASDADITSQDPESVFSPENIAPQNFQLEENTLETDNYFADQQIDAAYAMVDLPILDWLRLVGGVRVERSQQSVTTFEPFNPDAVPVVAGLDDTDVLFGANAKIDFTENMGLRVAGARTVNRPDFRELSEAVFFDVTGGRMVFGNPDLQRAVISHADLRWEWYPTPGETVSVGGFYKHLDDPIETIVVPSAQLSITYDNAEAADNVGAEVEVRKDFAFIAPPLQDLSVSANATYIYSRVDLSDLEGEQTSKRRALQGQSPFLLNAMLSYDNVDIGLSVNLIYNVFARRIIEVGAAGMPDVYEMPFHLLDFTVSQELGKSGFSLKFAASNLIDPEARVMQGDYETESYRSGRKFSLSLSWKAPAPKNKAGEDTEVARRFPGPIYE